MGEWFGVMMRAKKDSWRIVHGLVKDPLQEEPPTVEDIVEMKAIEVPREVCGGPNLPVRFRLNPYFGGNLTSPEFVEIDIQYIRGGWPPEIE
jgi:hypothetical protein